MDVTVTNWLAQGVAPEYCFLWINHWATCMTKSEWSGWMQAVFSVAAIAASAVLLLAQFRLHRMTARDDLLRSRQESALGLAQTLEEASGRIRRALGLFNSGRTLDPDDFEELVVACDVVRSLNDSTAPTVNLRVVWRHAQSTLTRAEVAITKLHLFFEEGEFTDIDMQTLIAQRRLAVLAAASIRLRDYVNLVNGQISSLKDSSPEYPDLVPYEVDSADEDKEQVVRT